MNETKCRKIVKRRAADPFTEIPMCEVRVPGVCLFRVTNYQHRKNKSQCSKAELWIPSNGLAICGHGNATGCHGYIHQNPAEAYENGWSVKQSRNPLETPVLLRHGLVLLDDIGAFTPALEMS